MDREFKQSITTTFTVLVAAVILIATFALGYILTDASAGAMRKLMNEYMLSISKTAAGMIDGDEFAGLTAEDVGSPKYNEVDRRLDYFKDNTSLAYIYSVRDMGYGHFSYVIDSDPDDPALFGERLKTTEALLRAAKGKSSVDREPHSDRWGKFYSAYSPILDSKGNVAGVVGVDFDATWYEDQINVLERTTFSIGVISLLVGAVVILIINARSRRSMRRVHGQLNVLSDKLGELRSELGIEGEEAKALKKVRRVYYEEDNLDSVAMKILDMQEELHEQISEIQKRADLDGMTGVSNKSKYLEDIRGVEEAMLSGSINYVLAVFDLISLKQYNDNLGHEAGDKAIVDAAQILIDVFGRENVYRVGGDEFIAGRSKATKDDMVRWFAEVEKAIEEKNKEGGIYELYPLGISKGCAEYDPETDESYMDVFRRADTRMYKDKAAYYMEHGGRRQRGREACDE